MPQHFPRALRASEGRKKGGFLQNQGFFNGLTTARGCVFLIPRQCARIL
jgi:hypothetical protein